MKNVILASCFALGAFGCGSQSKTSETASAQAASAPVRSVKALVGTISSVKAESARSPASGLWTTVTVSYNVPCYEHFENASASYRSVDGKLQIVASAFSTFTKREPGQLVCQSLRRVDTKVVIPGIVSKDALELVNLDNALDQIVPVDTISIQTIKTIKVLSTRPQCPVGAMCITNGTVVTLDLTLASCADTVGPIVFSAVQTDNNLGVSLSIKALDLVSKNAMVVRCITNSRKATITLPMIFGTKDSIALSILN